jgi:hypothetical protein
MVRMRFLPIEESPLISRMLASTRSSSPDICHFPWHCCKQMFKRGQCTGKVIQGWLWAARSTENVLNFWRRVVHCACLEWWLSLHLIEYYLLETSAHVTEMYLWVPPTYIWLRLAYKTCCCGHAKSSDIPWSFKKNVILNTEFRNG